MGTLPIERSGDVGRITLQEGGVCRNRTQADDPGAAHSRSVTPAAILGVTHSVQPRVELVLEL